MTIKLEDITEEDFADFEEVRESGETNMFDIGAVSRLSGLDRPTILCIMENYNYLAGTEGRE